MRQKFCDTFKSVRAFEDTYKNSKGYVTSDLKANISMPEYIQQVHEAGFSEEMTQPIFWTKELYERVEQTELDDSRCVDKFFQGKTLRGIWRNEEDCPHPLPTGVIRRSDFDRHYAHHSKKVAAKEDEAKPSDMKAIMLSATRAISDVNVSTNSGTKDVTITPSKEAKKDRKLLDFDSDDDFLPSKRANVADAEYEENQPSVEQRDTPNKRTKRKPDKEPATPKPKHGRTANSAGGASFNLALSSSSAPHGHVPKSVPKGGL